MPERKTETGRDRDGGAKGRFMEDKQKKIIIIKKKDILKGIVWKIRNGEEMGGEGRAER